MSISGSMEIGTPASAIGGLRVGGRGWATEVAPPPTPAVLTETPFVASAFAGIEPRIGLTRRHA